MYTLERHLVRTGIGLALATGVAHAPAWAGPVGRATTLAAPFDLALLAALLVGMAALVGGAWWGWPRRTKAAVLRERSQLLAAVLDTMPSLVFVKDGEGRFLYVNPRFEAFVGRPRDQIVGKTDEDIFPASEARRSVEATRKVLEANAPVESERTITGRDGPHTFRVTKFPLRGRDGVPWAVGGVATDVTELRALAATARESERRFRHVVEHSTNLFYAHTPDHVFTYVSPQSRRFFGCAPEEAMTRWTEFVSDHPANARVMEATMRAIQTGERQPPYEAQLRRRDGSTFWVEISETPIVQDGRVVEIVGAVTDIDERKRAEESLSTANATLRAIIEASPVAILTLDTRARVLSWNAAAERIFGWTEAEVLGRLPPFLPPRTARDFQAVRASLFVEGHAVDMEVPRRRKDGTTIVVHVRAAPIRAADGEIVGAVALFADVTCRRRDEVELLRHRDHLAELVAERTRELEDANRELETFSYTVSHDLRAPLRAIDGFSRLLEEQASDRLDPTARQFLARIRAAAGRMARLIDDLLELSRVTRRPLHREPVDLTALARSIEADLRAGEPGRDVVVAVEEGLVADGDAALLRSLLQNLLSNAWKFTSKRSCAHIAVGARREPGERVYFVRDDGAGFDTSVAGRRLFTPFQRFHAPSEFEGTGIGLATAQRIVQRHGGRIWAESTVGGGATFSFTLGEEPPGDEG